jgi:alkylation response protein AidB-like acyl-CoA dehydrogenase
LLAGTAIQGGGQAVPVAGGYRVSGRWSFGSGCRESTWMLGSFQILDDGTPRRDADGAPRYWRGVFKRAEIEIVPGSWNVDGMRGTGSFDWTVADVFLPERRMMDHPPGQLDNQWSRWPGISYALPVQTWLGPHHCSVITGIARAGIDALVELAGAKTPRGPGRSALVRDNMQVQEAVGRADAMLNAGRIYRSAAITELWNTVAAGRPTTREQRARCRLAATYAADCARQAMDLMFRHGGSTGYRSDSHLARCWRDLQVVGQAATLLPEWYPLGGRILLGMEPNPRLQ